jgi:hypothetical protein
LQVAVLAIEVAFANCVLSFVTITPEIPKTNHRTILAAKHSENKRYEDAENYVLDFLRPRGSLLLSIALLGMRTPLTRYTGHIQPMAIVLWFLLEQLMDCQGARACQ